MWPRFQLVEFSIVTQRHLNLLGLDVTFDIDIDQNLVEAANKAESSSNAILSHTALKAFEEYFNVSVSIPSSLPISQSY